MKEPYEKGVAHHLDPESWVTVHEGGGQALTGARVGRAVDGDPGSELEVDTGWMTKLEPRDGGRVRRFRAFIFTPNVSREAESRGETS